MTELMKPASVASSPDVQARSAEAKNTQEGVPNGDFRHLLQSQVSTVNQTAAGVTLEQAPQVAQEMPQLELHDRSREIGRVILTGGANTAQDSQLTQFMRDHGFSEGGMAGYMKQTMLGAGAAVAQASSEGSPSPIQELSELPGLPPLIDDAPIELNMAAALGAVPASSQTADNINGLNPVTASKPESLVAGEAKLAVNAPPEMPLPAPTDAVIEDALMPASTKEILTAQWPQLNEDNKQTSMAQAASQESSDLDMEFSNQQQSGQRSGQGDQSGTIAQNNSASNEEAQSKAQQYREWSERFSEMLGTRLAVAVREGSWSVQLDLDAMDLGSVAIQLNAGEDGIQGLVTSSDPAVRQLLADSLPKLQAALERVLSDKVDSPTVSLSLGAGQKPSTEEFNTITLSAEELAQALPADFKAGDGLNVFV